MALVNQLDAVFVQKQLTTWLAKRYPDGPTAVLSVEKPIGGGASNETIFFTAQWTEPDGTAHDQQLVARVRPAQHGLFPATHHDVQAEFRVLDALSRHTPVPIPSALWVDTDPMILGGEFIVMPFVSGRIPGDDPPFTVAGWFLDLSADQVATLHGNALNAMIDLHSTDWESLDLHDSLTIPSLGADGLDQILQAYENYFDWAREGDPNPTLESARDWLRTNRPPEPDRLVMCWGDARIGNMIFADDLSVAAILDLEMATLAAPEYDLAWWNVLNRHHTEGVGGPVPPGFPSEAEVVERYERLTGHKAEHLHYYEVLSLYRFAIMMVAWAG